MNVLSPLIEVTSITLSTVMAEDMCRASIETAALPRWLYPDGDRFEFRYPQFISSNNCSPSDCFLSSYFSYQALFSIFLWSFLCAWISTQVAREKKKGAYLDRSWFVCLVSTVLFPFPPLPFLKSFCQFDIRLTIITNVSDLSHYADRILVFLPKTLL